MNQLSQSSSAARANRARWMRVRRIVKRGFYGLFATAIVAAIAAAWIPRPLAVEAASVVSGSLRVTVDEDGQARIKDRYVVSAPIAGSLARIGLDPGDRVKQGDILARLEPIAPALLDARGRATATAKLAQAVSAQRQSRIQSEQGKTTADYASGEAARSRQLFERGAGSRAQLDQAELSERRANQEYTSLRFAARVADFEVEMSRAALDHLPGSRGGTAQLTIPSPITGKVLKILHKSEGVVQPGAPLFEVGDPLALEVVIDVLTSDAARIRPGANVVLDGWGGTALAGRVRRMEPSAFTRMSALGVEEQRVNLLVDLLSPQEHWRELGDGYRVEAHVVVWEGTVLKAPASALFRQEAGWALFRIDAGVARLTPITIGQRTAHEVEVLTGLSLGQKLIVYPSDHVKDGIKVVAQ